MSAAERQARYRAARADNVAAVTYRQPADRRTRPQQWRDAVATLVRLLDTYEGWRDRLPDSLAESATAERLDAVMELRDLVEQLQAAELPKGFGRD